MDLFPDSIANTIPKIGSTHDKLIAILKIFNPYGIGTWWIAEASAMLEDGSYVSLTHKRANERVDVHFFGFVLLIDPRDAEYGTISLNDLKSIQVYPGCGLERDVVFVPTPLKEIEDRVKTHSLS